jgi:dienelactone hydrolase
MRKVLFLGALALGVSACEPDIAQDPPPAAVDRVVAEFDPAASPAVVPTPNDLAINPATGLVNAPVNPSSPAAEQYFTRDYLNTLDGFPTSVSASTTVKDADPLTVNANTVKILDLYEGTPLSQPVPSNVVIGYNEDTDRINVLAPTGWPKGGRYAVVLVSGENGIKSTSGAPIIASSTWAFASSTESLVTCQDLTAPNCRTATELIPSTETDPARRLADQTATALRLEQLRRSYAPVIDRAAEKFSLKREDIVLLWTFRIMNSPEVTFDLTTSTIPFPNDLLRIPAQGTTPARLNLPAPRPGASPLEVQLTTGLNSLDGWSTTAPIISENSPTRGFIDAAFDPASVQLGRDVLFLKVSNPTTGTPPQVRLCFNCASSLRQDGSAQTLPQFQIIPEVPLDEGTTYAVVIRKGLKDLRDRVAEPTASQVLLRSPHPLFADGRSQVSVLPDSLAQQLEQARLGMKPLYDSLEAQGIRRTDINLAWAFTTQSTRSVLERLNAAPAQANVPADPFFLTDQTATLRGAMAAVGLANDAVGRAFVGAYISPYLLSDTEGVLNRAQPRADRLPFMLFLPTAAAPEGGYPVVVFGHGLTGNRTNVLSVANTLNANGFAVAAIDTVLHGERTSCAGLSPQNAVAYGDPQNPTIIDSPNEACTTGSTCDVEVNSPTFGRCVAPSSAAACDPRPTDPANPAAVHGDLVCAQQGQGRCLSTGRCEGGDFLRPSANEAPYISGWNFLNLTNLFATRDNFRHHVVDFAQFARVLAAPSLNARLTAASAGTLNAAQVDYVGQSLGSLQGPLSASVSGSMRRVALNVGGGGLVDVLLTATNPAFVQRRAGFNALLASVGRPVGTPGYDEFITLARTILDPADARNYARFLETAPSAPQGREAFVQYIQGDDVIPNPLTSAFLAAANRPGARTVQSYLFTEAQVPLPVQVRHGFFNIINPQDPGNAQLRAIRDAAQGQVAAFLLTGTAP